MNKIRKKNTMKFFRIIAIVAIIGFLFFACDNGNGSTHTHAYVYTVTSTSYPAQSIQTCTCGDTTGIQRDTLIGDTGPAGGKIIYVHPTTFPISGGSAKYLEAAPSNQATSIKWSSIQVDVTGATGTVIGTGKANTAAIIAAHSGDTTSNNAAKAANITIGDKSDWFLPSIDELKKMYEARNHLGISSGYFWSSSQYYSDVAWVLYFDDGSQYNKLKNYSNYYVRAMRVF